ncbi:hypothetical protein HC256_004178 [Beauveria bassiana]|nr:hypothetical protein HC256_004178 [Beauveria bassiana]
MLRTALNLREAVDGYFSKWKEAECAGDELSADDWAVLGKIKAFLEKLKMTTKALESSFVTLDHVLLAMDFMLAQFEAGKAASRDDPMMSPMYNSGWAKLDKYYCLTDESPAYVAAIVLHPSHKWHYVQENWRKDWVEPAKALVDALYCTGRHRLVAATDPIHLSRLCSASGLVPLLSLRVTLFDPIKECHASICSTCLRAADVGRVCTSVDLEKSRPRALTVEALVVHAARQSATVDSLLRPLWHACEACISMFFTLPKTYPNSLVSPLSAHGERAANPVCPRRAQDAHRRRIRRRCTSRAFRDAVLKRCSHSVSGSHNPHPLILGHAVLFAFEVAVHVFRPHAIAALPADQYIVLL